MSWDDQDTYLHIIIKMSWLEVNLYWFGARKVYLVVVVTQ